MTTDDEWREKMCYTYTQQNIFSLRKEENSAMCYNMNEIGRYCEISQTEKDKYGMVSCLFKFFFKGKLIETEKRIMVYRSWRVGEIGRDWSKYINFQL